MLTRIAKNLVLATFPAIVVLALALEVFFRFVIPAAEVPTRYFDKQDKIIRFDTEGPREGVFTRGRWAQYRARWRINNYGWNSEIDYLPAGERKATRPLIAIIGDSFLNGFQVDPEENLAGVLRRKLKEQFDVYSFAIPGAPLSQYLQMSRYVDRYFGPQILVFNVVHNDFHPSLAEITLQPSYMQITRQDGGFVERAPHDDRRSGPLPWTRSATLRYLKITLKSFFFAGQVPTQQGTRFVANVPVDVIDANRDLIRDSAFYLVKRIAAENPKKTLIFMMDAPRLDLYSGQLDRSGVRWLNDLLEEVCRAHHVAFVDLRKDFAEAFRKNGLRFESEIDAHWNEAGHREAARALHRKLVELGIAAAEP